MNRISLPETAHRLLEQRLTQADIAVDATLGNGYDTVFLARRVGFVGHVYGFDIQPAALEATRTRLHLAGLLANVTLFLASHAEMASYLPSEHLGRIRAVMFNLGYLPGGDKTIITRSESTLAAVAAACQWLAPGGMMTLLAYPGHPGGDYETERLKQRLKQLEPSQFHCEILYSRVDKPAAPRLFCLEKRR